MMNEMDTFNNEVQKCLDSICGLMFEYGIRWIYHLDDVNAGCDIMNATRARYGLQNNLFDPDEFLAAHGW